MCKEDRFEEIQEHYHNRFRFIPEKGLIIYLEMVHLQRKLYFVCLKSKKMLLDAMTSLSSVLTVLRGSFNYYCHACRKKIDNNNNISVRFMHSVKATNNFICTIIQSENYNQYHSNCMIIGSPPLLHNYANGVQVSPPSSFLLSK